MHDAAGERPLRGEERSKSKESAGRAQAAVSLSKKLERIRLQTTAPTAVHAIRHPPCMTPSPVAPPAQCTTPHLPLHLMTQASPSRAAAGTPSFCLPVLPRLTSCPACLPAPPHLMSCRPASTASPHVLPACQHAQQHGGAHVPRVHVGAPLLALLPLTRGSVQGQHARHVTPLAHCLLEAVREWGW